MQSNTTAQELAKIARLIEFTEEGLCQANSLLDNLRANQEAGGLNLEEILARTASLQSDLEALDRARWELITSRFRI